MGQNGHRSKNGLHAAVHRTPYDLLSNIITKPTAPIYSLQHVVVVASHRSGAGCRDHQVELAIGGHGLPLISAPGSFEQDPPGGELPLDELLSASMFKTLEEATDRSDYAGAAGVFELAMEKRRDEGEDTWRKAVLKVFRGGCHMHLMGRCRCMLHMLIVMRESCHKLLLQFKEPFCCIHVINGAQISCYQYYKLNTQVYILNMKNFM